MLVASVQARGLAVSLLFCIVWCIIVKCLKTYRQGSRKHIAGRVKLIKTQKVKNQDAMVLPETFSNIFKEWCLFHIHFIRSLRRDGMLFHFASHTDVLCAAHKAVRLSH